jgi:hypothetical protein
MITKLTQKQIDKIPSYRDKWLEVGKDTTPITYNQARPIIDDLYTQILGYEKPLIIIMPNPVWTWHATVVLHELVSQIDSQIRSQIRSQIYSQIDSQIYPQIDPQIRSQIDSQIHSQIDSQIDSQIHSQIVSQIVSQIDSQIHSQIDSQIRPQIVSQIDSQIYPQIDPQIRSQIDSQIAPQIRSQIVSQIDSQIYSQIDSQIDSQIHSQIDSQLDSQIHSQIVSQIVSQIRSQLVSQIYSQLDSQIRPQIGSQIENFLWPYLDGQLWASYFGYYEYFFNEVVKCECAKYCYFRNTTALNLIYPLSKICILSQKPKSIRMVNGLLHNESGPSISFDENFSVWSLNGVRVPQWLAETKDTQIKPERIIEIENAEVRREFVRKVGIERICTKLKAKILHKSTDGIYELLELDLNQGRKWKYLKMRNMSLSTDNNDVWHIEGVNNRCRTIQEALLYRINGENRYKYNFAPDGDNWQIHGDVIIIPEGAKTLKPKPQLIA